MRMSLRLRFDYGNVVPWVRHDDGDLAAIAGPDSVWLHTSVELHGRNLATEAEFTVSPGQRIPFVLTYQTSHLPRPKPVEPEIALDETESFWLVPWLGGFGGSVFADDGVTPTLDTDAMKGALQFLYDIKYTDGVFPSECDYNCANDLFKSSDAAMIVNGDWAMGEYSEALPDDLGVAPLPTVSATGEDPKPYTAGAFWMVPSATEGDTLTVVLDFMAWSTNVENQVKMVEELRRLPANAEALGDPIVTDDPLLAGAAEAVTRGTPQPTNVEMRCVFDAMTPAIRDVMGAGNSNIDQVTQTMQEAAENCIAALG